MIPPQPGLFSRAGDRGDDRRAKLGALRGRLHQAAQALRTPGDWAACLSLAARLPGQDWGNILLINAQRPGGTQLGDYRAVDRDRTAGPQGRDRDRGLRHPAPC